MKRFNYLAAYIALLAALAIASIFAARAEAATVAQIFNGGTGTSTTPAYGQILIGGKNGEYEYVASSTFGGGGSGAVNSVFGRTGTVTAQSGDYTTSQVTEGTNLYFTNARAVSALTGQNISIFTNNANYITGNQNITLSGDVTGTGATAITTAFNLLNPHWWTATQNFTNASTSQLTATSSIVASYLTVGSLVATDANDKLVSSSTIGNAQLANNSIIVTTGAPLGGAATVPLGGTLALTCSGCLTGNQTITLSGDETGSGATAITTAFNLGNAHWWTGRQNFTNASTSQFTATSTVWLTALGTPAGTFLAVDPNGKIIATSTPAVGGGGTVTSVATDGTLTGGTITTTGTLGINLSNSNTWAAIQNFSAAASSSLFSANTAWFNVFNATSTTGTSTITNALRLGSTAASRDNLLQVDCSGTSFPASVSTGGCVNIDGGSGNNGPQLEVQGNRGAGATGRMIVFNQQSTADVQDMILASSSCANCTDLNLKGDPTGKGVFKIEMTGSGTGFSNSSGLSIDGENCTDCQDIFVDRTGGAGTGNILNLRDNSVTRLLLTAAGQLTVPGNASTSILSLNAGPLYVGGTTATDTISANSTSTFATGINLTSGCLTYNGGACVGGSGGGGTVVSVQAATPNSTLTIGGTNPITGSGTINFDLSLTHSNWWQATQNFTNASSSELTATSSVWFTGVTGSSLLAVDNNGKLIASSTIGTNQIQTTGVSAGSYTNTNLTVNAAGQITSASNGPDNVATSSAETATDIPWWTSTAGTPAQLSGGSSSFQWLNPGLLDLASSTIGNNTQAGGLTINGGATTTGTAYIAGKLGVSTTTPNLAALYVAYDGVDSTSTVVSAPSSLHILAIQNWSSSSCASGPSSASFGVSNNALSIVAPQCSNGRIDFDESNGTNTNIERMWQDGGITVGHSASDPGTGIIETTNGFAVATTTPWAALSVAGTSLGTKLLFDVSTSTATATSTVFQIDQNGNTTIGGNSSVLTVNGATSTYANGINLTTGCFSISGTCIGGGGGSGTVSSGTQGQFAFYQTTGTVVSGTTTINVATNDDVGIGSTTPGYPLSVKGNTDITGNLEIDGNDDGHIGIYGQTSTGASPDITLAATRSPSGQFLDLTLAGSSGIGNTLQSIANSITFFGNNNSGGMTMETGGGALRFSSGDTLGSQWAQFNSAGLFQTFDNASTTNLSDFGTAYFGGTATTTITNAGFVGIASSTPWTDLVVGSGSIIVTEASSTGIAENTIDFKAQQTTKIEMTQNTTINLADDAVPGDTQKVILCQDPTGSRTVTWLSSTSLDWAGGTTPTITATAKQCDVFSFIVSGATGTTAVFGAATQNF